ncbi:ParB/RepB/Spo0J family partition protein [Rouxiella badensis]|uniref:ParB family protein n=1 Tax=Rouxiella badensis TaxID=1646377 RepID=UPI001D142306|nr:ParB family protein [Rouxiella badensis]MCC3721638.1 ParB/RepB/Spo0J family partition protein [Rouxiella badensis]MCC3731293.1 ParB/RepB/Spo0J family partition protein [Rouxiella badensis]MCC3735875.1 ParB/RepB/Spo0J family partition protein [Rouxiella badensis]MCC3742871.1 ParB/RepB/Spo0J family partition protein [Rouxiella badensis]MCC3761180.1 ParB/RepB/Spo0J family partition protein [Rouxiella badensis]
MNANRKVIGRTFSQSSLNATSSEDGYSQRFTLASGKVALFHLEQINANSVAEDSFVQLENNGRDQSALTNESLADIIRTIRLQQFFPAIGRKVDGRIEILDGSRRRASAIIAKVGLLVLVTAAEISVDDARQLATDIQTAKEHNLREVGLRLLMLREGGMSQKDIAASQKLSEAKVTRAIQAASVPSEMLHPFPVQSELTYPDYKFLFGLNEQLIAKGINTEELIDQVMELKSSLNNDYAAEDYKTAIINLFKEVSPTLLERPTKDAFITQKLWEFSDKDKYARKKTKGRLVNYEFSRLPKELHEELDIAIMATIRKHLSE